MTIPQQYKTFAQHLYILQNRLVTFYNPQHSEQPVVSIICPFDNEYFYFEEGYKSIINQTFQNFEILIVDDCSTDTDSIRLFQSLPERSPKIKTFSHDTKKGSSAGCNTAISHAKGKYLFFMNLQDIIEPTYLEKCLLFLELHPDFSFANSYVVNFQGKEDWYQESLANCSQLLEKNVVKGQLMYRKKDFEALGEFDKELKYYGTWERCLRGVINQQKGWTIPEYLDFNRCLVESEKVKVIKQEEKRKIQEQYFSLFQNNQFPKITVKEEFTIEKVRQKLNLKKSQTINNSNKNILCLFRFFEVGGADKFSLDVVRCLAKRGYNITIVTTEKSLNPWHHKFYEITPDIFHFPQLFPASDWPAFIRFIIESRSINLGFISNSYFAYYSLPCLKQEFPNLTFVDYTHAYRPNIHTRNYAKVSAQLSCFLDSQIVSSYHQAKYYKTLNTQTQEKLKICYTNIDQLKWTKNLEKRKNLRNFLKISPDTIVFVFPARLTGKKRPLFLVDIAKALSKMPFSFCMLVLGEGDLRQEIENKIQQQDLAPVFQVLDFVGEEEMVAYYSAADIFILPSESEGISLALYEAMSMELPVVVSDVGGQRELVTPGTGYLIPKGDGDAIEVQAYLEVLVPLMESPQLRQQVGQQARKRVVESFTLEAMGNQMDGLFQEAMQRHSYHLKPEMDSPFFQEMFLVALEYRSQSQRFYQMWEESQSWIQELQRGKDWLETEHHKAQSWIQELQKGKYWLEAEHHKAKTQIQKLQKDEERLKEEINLIKNSPLWQLYQIWYKINNIVNARKKI